MWHILEKQSVQGYQIGYSQRITRGSYKDRDKDKDKDKDIDKDKDKDKDKVQRILYMWHIFEKQRVQRYQI